MTLDEKVHGLRLHVIQRAAQLGNVSLLQSRLTVRLIQGRLQPPGELRGVVGDPEMLGEQPRCIHEPEVVERVDVDAVLLEGPGDEVTGGRVLRSAAP